MSAILLEIGPVFRALLRNRPRFFLLALEIALTLAIAVNCANLLIDLRSTLERPSGIDEENIVVLTVRPFAPELVEEERAAAQLREDIDLLRGMSGVRSAASLSQVPLSGGGSASSRKAYGTEQESISTPYFLTTPGGVEALGVEIVQGRNLVESDYGAEIGHENVLLTEAMATLLFPDGDALGKQISNGGETRINTVVGIVRQMANSWPEDDIYDRAMLVAAEPEAFESYNILARVEPGTVAEMTQALPEALLGHHAGRLVEARTLAQVRASHMSVEEGTVRLLSLVIILLGAITTLGIVGLTSFSVTERTRQIGTRRALGATRGAIRRHFLVEIFLVTSVGLVVGVALAWGLNVALLRWVDGVSLEPALLGLGMAALWAVGLFAAWLPAERGARVAPVAATRSV